MTPWLEEYYRKLELKREAISKSDFRFYNISHLPLIAKKTADLSGTCSTCKSNIDQLERLLTALPECLQEQQGRKEYEHTKTKIEDHLKSDHNIRLANYFYSLFTLLGILLGGVLGCALSFILYKEIRYELPILLFIIGLIAGQILGKRKDKIQIEKNLTI